MTRDKSRTDLILTIREGKRIIEAGRQAVKMAEDEIAVIQGDQDRSDSYKARRTDEIRDNLDHALQELSASAEVVYSKLDARLAASLNDYDFSDDDFQKALMAVSTMGKSLPFSMQDQIAERFRGRPEMLKAIKGIYQANGFSTSTVDQMLSPFESFSMMDLEPLREVIIYGNPVGARATWKSNNGVVSMLDKLAGAYAVDTSINPYAAEIKEIRAGLDDDTYQARKIDSWLAVYGDALAEDMPGACELADAMISEWTEGKP